MLLLPILIAAEIIFGLAITHPYLDFKQPRSIYNAAILAQDATPAPVDTTAPPVDITVPPDTSAPAENTPEAAPEAPPTEAAPEAVPQETLESPPEAALEAPPVETQPVTEGQTVAPAIEFNSQEKEAVSEVGSLTNVDNIAPAEVDKAQSEDAQMAQITTPEESVSLLIDLVGNKTDDISNLTENSDFTTTTFVAQRIDNQIDQALAELGGLSPEASSPLKEKLIQFSEIAEPIFRSEQLVVPDNLEQDFEIIRGKLLNIQRLQ